MNTNELSYNIILLVGLAIFIYSFLPQVISIYKTKDTLGVVPKSWLMNYVGRMLWVPFSMFNAGPMGLIMLIGQGIIAALNIPIIYYAYRNSRSRGIYQKEDYKKGLFLTKVFLIVFTIIFIIFGIIFQQKIIDIKLNLVSDTLVLILGIVTTFATAIAFLPQTYKVLKTRNTVSIVLRTTLLFAIGNTLAVISLILKASIHFDEYFTKLIGSIMLGSVSTGLMYIISLVKIRNILKKRKVIFMFDLDGTLLADDTFKVPLRTEEFLIKLKKHGYRLAINTGRPFEMIENIFTKRIWNLFSLVSGYNGTYIKNGNNVTKHNLEKEFVNNFIEQNKQLTITISVGNKLYTNNAINSDAIIKRIKPEVVPLTAMDLNEVEAYTIRIICKNESETKRVFEELKKKYSESHDLTMSTGVFILITKKGINKASVVNELMSRGNKIVYFGDSHNDLSVFNLDGVYKVAPANAYDEIKAKADMVLETNNDESLEFDFNELEYIK